MALKKINERTQKIKDDLGQKQRNNEDSKRALLRPSILTLESKKDQRKEKKESFDKGRRIVMHSRKGPYQMSKRAHRRRN